MTTEVPQINEDTGLFYEVNAKVLEDAFAAVKRESPSPADWRMPNPYFRYQDEYKAPDLFEHVQDLKAFPTPEEYCISK